MSQPSPIQRGQDLLPRAARLLQDLFHIRGYDTVGPTSRPAVPVQDALQQLRSHVLGLQLPITPSEEEWLRPVVCDYVDAMKAAGRQTEQIIVSLKSVLRDGGIYSEAPFEAPNETSRLWDRVVGWCIQRYYFG